jgi:hypothetical protein
MRKQSVVESRKGIPLLGEMFPEIQAQTAFGVKMIPVDCAGKGPTVLSHSAHFTPICTTEFVAFANRFEESKKLDCELLGSPQIKSSRTSNGLRIKERTMMSVQDAHTGASLREA